jgi:hypothetical protein
MCTALTINENGLYFGRTLDLDVDYNQQIVITPCKFNLSFTNGKNTSNHYAIIGMATVVENYPLYFDAVNEKGLCIAGLNFSEDAVFEKPNGNKIRRVVKMGEGVVYRNSIWLTEENDELAKNILANYFERKIEILEHEIQLFHDRIHLINDFCKEKK